MLLLLDEVRANVTGGSQPDGFNIGINDGAAAGQTIPHVHIHLIPRYDGDVADPRGGVRWVLPARPTTGRAGSDAPAAVAAGPRGPVLAPRDLSLAERRLRLAVAI